MTVIYISVIAGLAAGWFTSLLIAAIDIIKERD